MEYSDCREGTGPDPGGTASAGVRRVLKRGDGISCYKEGPVCGATTAIETGRAHGTLGEQDLYPSVQEGAGTTCEAVPSAYFLIVHTLFPLTPLAFNPRTARGDAFSSQLLFSLRQTNLGRGQTWLYPHCPDSSVPCSSTSDSLSES